MVVGIICEYNPFHNGHKKQIDRIKQRFGPDCAVVCLMSGNFVQRGAPAVFPKEYRAKAALACGADLVLELPVTAALSSAEGFAQVGVSILSRICTHLCFGAENEDPDALLKVAKAMCQPEFTQRLKEALETGISFPAARQQALESMGCDADLLQKPNNILATEYCKAILQQESPLKILPIQRQGNYHDTTPDLENPSATALRNAMEENPPWQPYVPEAAFNLFQTAPRHTLLAGQRAILGKLRWMSDAEFEALPYGSEGLWRKLMHNVRACSDLEQIATATKSKRYTRSRIDRMLICAFLGITKMDLASPAPYCRVLGFNQTGRNLLSGVKKQNFFMNAGETQTHPYQTLETRCEDLYPLFCVDAPGPCGLEKKQRIIYEK